METNSRHHEKHDSERIVFHPDSAYVRTSVTAVIVVSALIICFLIVFLGGANLSEFHTTSIDFGAVMTFCSIASFICLILCWSSFFTSKRSYFDLVNGVLYPLGKANAQNCIFYKDFDHLEIQNAIGGYVLYLVLKDGRNINIVTNMRLLLIQQDAIQLSKRLSLPLEKISVEQPQPENSYDITTDKLFIRIE